MTNHPNRRRLGFRVSQGADLAAFREFPDACAWAKGYSVTRGLVEVHDRSGLIAQYDWGSVTREFEHVERDAADFEAHQRRRASAPQLAEPGKRYTERAS